MPRKPVDPDGEIRSPQIKDNDTWNTCPNCGHNWKDAKSTPGLIHRSRLCGQCIRAIETNSVD